MSKVDTSTHSSRRAAPTVVHYHKNQPVVQPYKPPEKDPPPGASLYKDVWFIFRVATQAFLCSQAKVPYGFGLALGAIKAGIEWSRFGPPKKISSDAESVDFGATAHTSSVTTQVGILAESFFAVAVPAVIDHPYFDYYLGHYFPELTSISRNIDSSMARTSAQFNFITGKSPWPTTSPQWLKWLFIGMHGVLTGEEVIQRLAKWIESPQPKKK